jgi:hypothetical protein
MPFGGYPRLVLILVAVFLLGVPSAAHAWTVTVHVHGAGGVDETQGRGFPNCEVSPTGKSESSSTDCVFGTPSGTYNSLDIVQLSQYVQTSAFTRGWQFSKWVDGSGAGRVNCDPQDTVGDHLGNDCKFQIFENLSVDLYFDDAFANPVDSLTSGPAAGSRTNATTASFNFNASGDPDSAFQCRLERPDATVQDWYGCGGIIDKSESFTGLTQQGAYTFRVRSVDPSANVGGSLSRTWTVDTVAPTVAIGGSPSAGATTNSSTAAFTLTPSETVTSYQCKLDRPGVAGAFAPCSTTANYSSLNADGAYTFSTYAVDSAGNTGSTATRSWTVDRTPPDSSISSGPSGPTNSTSASFNFSATGGATGYECQLDPGSDWEPCSTGKTYSSLAPGGYTFSVRATDAVGNVEGTPATRTFTVDTQPPDTSIDSGPSGSTSSNSAAFGFSATESGVTFECKLDSGPWETCTTGKTYSSLALGAHTVYVRARDQAGNVDGSEASRSWTVTAPTSTTPGGTPPGPTPPGATPDTTKPVAVLSFAKQPLARALKRGLGGSASTTEPGTLVLDVLYRGKKVATSGKRSLAGPGALKLVAKFTRKGKRTLGRMRKVRVTLMLTARDAAGNATVKKKTVTLKR